MLISISGVYLLDVSIIPPTPVVAIKVSPNIANPPYYPKSLQVRNLSLRGISESRYKIIPLTPKLDTACTEWLDWAGDPREVSLVGMRDYPEPELSQGPGCSYPLSARERGCGNVGDSQRPLCTLKMQLQRTLISVLEQMLGDMGEKRHLLFHLVPHDNTIKEVQLIISVS